MMGPRAPCALCPVYARRRGRGSASRPRCALRMLSSGVGVGAGCRRPGRGGGRVRCRRGRRPPGLKAGRARREGLGSLQGPRRGAPHDLLEGGVFRAVSCLFREENKFVLLQIPALRVSRYM